MHHSVIAGKLVLKVSKILGSSGSTWPGHIALKTDHRLINKVMAKNPGVKIILVAGTNGKTTTTKALSHILDSQKLSVLTNVAGANLLNGLASMLVNNISLSGKLTQKAIIFEVDENSLPIVLSQIPNPDGIILLNLFRDQLDRYGEVNSTAEKWIDSLKRLTEKTLVVANADDPQIVHIANSAISKTFFTIDNTKKIETQLSHAVDSTTCPQCSNQLMYSRIAYSHIGNFKCSNCEFANPKAKSFVIQNTMLGSYNLYNLSAAILAADRIFKIIPYNATESLKTFKPAFGRQETIDIDEKKIMVLLSKNPTGFNESLKVSIENKSETLLILLNDRVPDGRDISWIWDVDFEVLQEKNLKVFVSGDRAYDMANRLLFANVTHEVFDSYEKAYQEALVQTSKGKTITILPTYSAMLEIRQLISGKKIL